MNKSRIAASLPMCGVAIPRLTLPRISPASQPRAIIWLRCPIRVSHADLPRFSITIRTVIEAFAIQKKLRTIFQARTALNVCANAVPRKLTPSIV